MRRYSQLFRCPISGAILGRRDPCTTAGFFDEPTTEPAERTASNPSLSPQSCACAPFAIPASWCVHALRMPPQAARLVPEQAHDRCPGGAQPSSRRSSTLRWASRARPPPRRFRRCAAAPNQASIPTLNRLIDASPAYQHGVLLPRRHAVELREHRPRQRLDGPGAWARHRRGRHRRRPLRCPRQVVSRVSRERSGQGLAGSARTSSQGAIGGPEAGSGGDGPVGRWSPSIMRTMKAA